MGVNEIFKHEIRDGVKKSERYYDALEKLAALDPATSSEKLTVLGYLKAWGEREGGNLGRGVALFSQIVADAAPTHRRKILFQKANALRESGSYRSAKPIYRALFDECREDDSDAGWGAIFTQQYADIEYVQGQRRTALQILSVAATAHAADDGFRLQAAEIHRIQGQVFRMNEQLARAVDRYEQARPLFEGASSIFGLARIETNLAETLMLVESERAIRRSRRAIELNGRLESHLEVGKGYNALGLSLLASGEPAEASKAIEMTLQIQSRVGYRSGIGMAILHALLMDIAGGASSRAPDDRFEKVEGLFASLDAYPLLVYKGASLLEAAGHGTSRTHQARESLAAHIEWLEDRDRFDAACIEHHKQGRILN